MKRIPGLQENIIKALIAKCKSGTMNPDGAEEICKKIDKAEQWYRDKNDKINA